MEDGRMRRNEMNEKNKGTTNLKHQLTLQENNEL
jgi:hypothetical protein